MTAVVAFHLLRATNGIAIEYTYDASANLTSITYKKNAAVIGNMTYEYDALGKRVRVGGSFARTGLPQAFISTEYGLGNRLTQRSGTNFTYDANGNLTNDGTFTYNWNARNELTSMSGPGIVPVSSTMLQARALARQSTDKRLIISTTATRSYRSCLAHRLLQNSEWRFRQTFIALGMKAERERR